MKTDQQIDAKEYTEEYFLANCDGYEAYLEFGGTNLTRRLQLLWHFLDVSPGMKVLDVGCGRGEMIVHCNLHGAFAVGVDYSTHALRLAQKAITQIEHQDWDQPKVSQSNAKHLPFSSHIFDCVIMSDIVEHLYPEELLMALKEIRRVLRPGGKLLIHTMPNLWYYHYGYPIFRIVQRLAGKRLPADPRKRFAFSHVHVNEQTPRTMSAALTQSGFVDKQVWLQDYRDYPQYSPMMRSAIRMLTHLPIIKLIFCDDIFAMAKKTIT